MRFLTAGESHGKCLIGILEGMVSNLPLSEADINKELARRQEGYGRGERMKIEKDTVEILSGLRKGKTIGSPIALMINNKSTEFFDQVVTKLRPGHADLAGALKYNTGDIRNILERSSARETAMRVAIGAICKKFLAQFKVIVSSKVEEIGGEKNKPRFNAVIDEAKEALDSVGGIFEIKIVNVPAGLGSHVHYDRRLNALLASALMSIPAIKGVEVGLGFEASRHRGSKVHDEIFYEKGKFVHKTNNAGGIEGGMTNGEPIILKAAMKPIATLVKPLKSVDFKSKKATSAHIERADTCAVEAAAVIGEAMAAFVLTDAFLQKFGGDSLEEIRWRL
ncbi:chorismate synthase [candidate division WOR-1 bacterium RIFOXYA12_FULL_43_27]|uniref:Chorismate synthase n=1 Tax=candidate division WOR-1 bacterium RIFOXYC2_FULL_46_14 TaxID=1802587 RepID=A0A1F4U521_UNCSA|nr:MAG: chorismate synthase [candidate division WOR-1 bacterium RIFOXYA12_FULL_43_27]OGC20957.1 MAG: chorismate synthase [candidate division WOR-1 bacterium RIFOXYB2_FULL_46_45]OGC32283.1 MAG: chorismate synthase [candidate division WOR-1 bacterium RIFOXYA2_FULL_46_56]OGC40036.1 MAG: chorismate synthase [candidate division WOR-1 bacterium RIFOXYC2_FULL_46_14]